MESIKNIKLSDYKLVAREAILKVIGKKYRDVANSKLDKILFIEHIDVEGLKDYINSLKDALGAENLNSLIDLVNYIDKLARCNDLYTDIKNVNYDSLVYQDYLSKIEKVINVYEEMERYQNSKKKIL